MSDEDAQFDGGDRGGQLEDSVGDFIGDKTDSQTMYYYGMYGMIHSVGVVLLYILLNGNRYVAFARAWWVVQIEYFAPVGFVWLMMGFFDMPLLKGIMRDVCIVSVLGPFFYLPEELIDYVLAGESSHWDNLMYYVALAAYFFYTVIQMVFQITLLPGVFSYLEEGEYQDPLSMMFFNWYYL